MPLWTLSPFKSFTCGCIACMDGGYSQGGAASFQGGANDPSRPPLNETLSSILSRIVKIRISPSWLNAEIIRTLRKRHYFHRLAKASSSNLFSHKYRLLRNFAISMVQKAKFAFRKSMSSSIQSPKQLWSLYHSLDPNCECIPKATLLNCFFYSCFLSQSSTSYELSPPYHPELSNIECSEEEVERLLCFLKTKTSTGPDRILSHMLRNTFYSTKYVSLPHFWSYITVHRLLDASPLSGNAPMSLQSTKLVTKA